MKEKSNTPIQENAGVFEIGRVSEETQGVEIADHEANGFRPGQLPD